MDIKRDIKIATEFAREFIKNHPEHKGEVLDYYSLMKDEIADEGGSKEHEIELFIGSCNDLLKKDNLSESGGGVYKGGGGVGKMYYHIIEYGQYDNIGYQGYYDTIEEAQKQVEKLSDFFPNQTFQIFPDKSRKEPPITTMAKGGGVEKAFAGYILLAEKLKGIAPKSFDSADEKLSEQIKNNNMYANGNTIKGGGDKKRSLMSMANLVVDDWKGEKIRDWYTKNYPTDELGKEINDITFEDLWNATNFDNIYDVIGVGDSLIRERLFEHLSEIYGVSYNYVYDKLFGVKRYEKGTTIKGGQFDRDKNGSLYDRGSSDSWYGRGKNPHWYPEGTYHGSPITKLTKEEIEEYNEGYEFNESEGGRKEYAKGNVIKSGGEIRRFNRHDDMDMNTLVEINDTINKLRLVGGIGQYKELINSLFGLFDGYDYSQTEDFKNKMQELNSENPELYNRIKAIYEEKINTYNFNSKNPMVYSKGGGVGKLKVGDIVVTYNYDSRLKKNVKGLVKGEVLEITPNSATVKYFNPDGTTHTQKEHLNSLKKYAKGNTVKGGENEDYSHKVGDRITDGTGRSGDIVEVKDNGTRVVKINYANGSVNPFVINVDENDIEYWTVLYAKGNTVKDKYRLTQQKVLDRGEINDSYPSDDGGSNQSEELEIIFEDKTYLIIVEFGERKKAKYPNMKATPIDLHDLVWSIKDSGEVKIPKTFSRKEVEKEINSFNDSNNEWTISTRELIETNEHWIINGWDETEQYAKGGGVEKAFAGYLLMAEKLKGIAPKSFDSADEKLSEQIKNNNMYAKGGGVGDENKEMVLNNNKQIRHHTEELHQILKKDKAEVPAWVVSKVGRATTDLSDATHYLEGSIEKAANGMKIGTGRAGKSLMVMDYKIWDKLNIESGSQLYDDKELQKRYAKEIKMGIEKLGYDQLNEKAFDYLENWNYHALNSALTYMGYYGLERLNRTLDFNKKMMEINRNNYGLDPNIFMEVNEKDSLLVENYNNGGGVSKYKKGGPVKDYTGTDFSKLIDDLKVFLIKYPYIWKKDGKSYVPIEGWQFAAALMGYTTRVVSVNEIENGYMSMAEVIDQDGKVVGSGFGLVTKDEAKWANSQKYELASFSQTRAVSRALRNCISWVIKAAGYKTTPAEEMYGVGSSKMQNMPKYNAPSTPKTIVQYPSMTPIKPPMTPPMTTEAPMPDAFEEMADMLRPQKSPMAKNPDFKYKDILRDLYSQAVAYSIVLISPKFMSDVEESLLVDDNDLHYTMLERAYLYLLDNNIVLKTTRYMTKLRKIVNGENFAYGGLLKELPIEIYNAIVESGHQNDIISFDIEPFNSDGDRDKTINVEGVDYYISTKINSEEIANDLNNNTSLNHNYYIADIGGNELLISNL
jgi:hypothetical protein